ncbi:unnamed protein product [Gadus morhua 'NCC']
MSASKSDGSSRNVKPRPLVALCVILDISEGLVSSVVEPNQNGTNKTLQTAVKSGAGLVTCVYWKGKDQTAVKLEASAGEEAEASCWVADSHENSFMGDPPSENPFLEWLNGVCVTMGMFFFTLAIVTFLLCSWNAKINNTARLQLCISLDSSHFRCTGWTDALRIKVVVRGRKRDPVRASPPRLSLSNHYAALPGDTPAPPVDAPTLQPQVANSAGETCNTDVGPTLRSEPRTETSASRRRIVKEAVLRRSGKHPPSAVTVTQRPGPDAAGSPHHSSARSRCVDPTPCQGETGEIKALETEQRAAGTKAPVGSGGLQHRTSAGSMDW